MHRCSGGGEGISRGIRASEPNDLIARADESGTTGSRSSGRASDENAHEKTPG
jgi:hypothetical protein